MDSTDTFDPEAFARLAQLEPDHFWFEERRDLIAWCIGRHFPNAQSYCEVGCGTGFVLERVAQLYPRLQIEGVDSYAEGLSYAAARLGPRVRLTRGSITELKTEPEQDVVGCYDVLEHIPNDALALRGLASRVRPGGGLLITVPQHPFLWSAADEIGHHQRRYRKADLLKLISAAGLTPIRITSFVSFLLPVLMLRRNRELSRDGALAELTPSTAANRLGSYLLGLERRLIRAGVSFPCGGSLLVVARKPLL